MSLGFAGLLLFIVLSYGVLQLGRIESTDHVEVNDYEGVQLSSLDAFRENSIRGPQKVNVTDYKLRIYGLVDYPVEYTYDEVLNDFPSKEKVVTLNCVEGWSATVLWEGVRVMDLVESATPEALIVIFHAEDGYTTSLTFDYIRENDLILAYKVNGITLPEENGFPFQLVAESKWGYKWCKWVTGLEFSNDLEYEGFWESRGYSNSADLEDSFRGG
ncbi:molybdopterin-dependent oxidoreductase [Candidatus Bathyarchaeota archaeon]|nr:molybdopterin-dependent oxidoreductase [Candidatus Bathyarchaeota archaeon]